MAVYARLTNIEHGYDSDKLEIKKYGLVVGSAYEVADISMGQSSTSIKLKYCNGYFNSVNFEFEEDGKPLNIYRDARFNPYIKVQSPKNRI